VGRDNVSDLFVVVDWIGVVWLVGSAGYLGWMLAAVAAGGAPRDGGSPRALLRRLGVIALLGILLAPVLDDGPVLAPWWLQWLVLFAAPTVAGAVVRRLRGPGRRRQVVGSP